MERPGAENSFAPGKETLLGLFFPTHGFTAPWPTIKFAFKLPLGKGTKAFISASRAGWMVGPWHLPGLEGTATLLIALILVFKGYNVRGFQGLDMPSNWLAAHWGLKKENAAWFISRGRTRTEQYTEKILEGKVVYRGWVFIAIGILLAQVSLGYLLIGRLMLAKVMFADYRCNSCGICWNNCPYHAIKKIGKVRPTPYWTFHCESCERCIAYCPPQAIQTGFLFLIVLCWIIYGAAAFIPAYAVGETQRLPARAFLAEQRPAIPAADAGIRLPRGIHRVLHLPICLKEPRGQQGLCLHHPDQDIQALQRAGNDAERPEIGPDGATPDFTLETGRNRDLPLCSSSRSGAQSVIAEPTSPAARNLLDGWRWNPGSSARTVLVPAQQEPRSVNQRKRRPPASTRRSGAALETSRSHEDEKNSRKARIPEEGNAGGCRGGRLRGHHGCDGAGGNAGAVRRQNSHPHTGQDQPETPDSRLRRRRPSAVWLNPLSLEDRIQLVRYAYDQGIRYFDTAGASYMESQSILGEALKDRRRQVCLVTKVDTTVPGEVRKSVEQSLKELQTDYLDILLIHGTPGVEQMSVEQAMKIHGELIKLRDERVTRFVGLSAHGYFDKALGLIASGGFDQCMLSYGYIPRGYNQIWTRAHDHTARCLRGQSP